MSQNAQKMWDKGQQQAFTRLELDKYNIFLNLSIEQAKMSLLSINCNRLLNQHQIVERIFENNVTSPDDSLIQVSPTIVWCAFKSLKCAGIFVCDWGNGEHYMLAKLYRKPLCRLENVSPLSN